MKWYNLPKDVSRKEAQLILKYMQDIIDVYGYVTLADFYDLCGSKVSFYKDTKKKLHRLTGAKVSLMRKEGRYRILLPDFVEGLWI